MTKFIPEQSRVTGSFPVIINGALTTLTAGANFTDTAELLAALDSAGISYETAKLYSTTGTASGRIKIIGTGSGATVVVNGVEATFAVNTWFTPSAEQLEALQNAPYLILEAEYTDQTPTAFTFTDATDVATSSTQTSNTITVAGLGAGVSVAVTVTGGTYSKNGGGYTSAAGTAVNGDTFAARHTSSASASTATNTPLTIGGVSDTFTSTTTAALAPGPNLATNGTFGSEANFTYTHQGGTHDASITAGVLRFTSDDDGNLQKATQTLAGGSSPAGTYRVTVDVGAGAVQVYLFGAADESRGVANFSEAGAGQTTDVVASGEVSKFQIRTDVSQDVDNFMLQLLS